MISRKVRRRCTVAFVLLLLVLCVFSYINKISYPLIVRITEAHINSFASNSVATVNATLRTKAEFKGKFYEYSYDKNGNVTLVSANSTLINGAITLAQAELAKAMDSLEGKSVPVHMGAFSGMTFLTNSGPVMGLQLHPIGSMECNVKSVFTEAGINQTRHRVVIEAVVFIDLVLPLKRVTHRYVHEIFLCENIIVGKVPEFYLRGGAKDVIDLLP